MMLTEDQARAKRCHAPIGVAHDAEVQGHCIASACMAWRYRPHPADEQWIEAVRKAVEELGDKSPNGQKAAKHVSQNRAKYGLPTTPTHGWCGLAGRPE